MRIAIVALGLLVAGCGAEAPRPQPIRPAAPVPIPRPTAGLERVIGNTEVGLAQMFGKPDVAISEGSARKLQFGSRICVLDAYLYPQPGRGDAKVTYIDARQRDGSAIDKASCVAALARRDGGK